LYAERVTIVRRLSGVGLREILAHAGYHTTSRVHVRSTHWAHESLGALLWRQNPVSLMLSGCRIDRLRRRRIPVIICGWFPVSRVSGMRHRVLCPFSSNASSGES